MYLYNRWRHQWPNLHNQKTWISLEQKKDIAKRKPPLYSTLKSLLNECIFSMTYFSVHMHFKHILSYLPSPTSLCHCSKSHHCLSVHIWGGGTKTRIRPTYLDRFKIACLSLWSVMVVWSQTWSEPTFVEPKMERKYATAYSTAEKWVSKS